ncbi:Cof-type HAD-IIB family hydrolase [Butyrivibrio sp. VCD2006]|uniref:Cof-type HAD-IIB family hydrolase n=1 Tax=Butyrivibrio sp. VCD2006 TaxID=1280664 RepID=UPI00041AB08F|nr:Cof-type HAD-IIB family hydrolase [Butyrivibrio sp. VCD2006]
MYKIIFCDVDGTLVNSEHRVTDLTRKAILDLKIPFVIVSARSPSGIYPILEKNGFDSAIIAFSGALIQDEDRNIIYQNGLEIPLAKRIIDFIESEKMSVAWNIFAGDKWIVKSRDDARVRREESIVEVKASEGSIEFLKEGEVVHKILCMCNPDEIDDIELTIRKHFPEVNAVKSSDILLEIMNKDVNKADSVKRYCDTLNIDTDEVVAFGDNYNDVEMLDLAGLGVLMGNAPDELKKRFEHITEDNDHDGIAKVLKLL